VDQVDWRQGSALDPSTYAHLLSDTTAVVHTLGILLENDYKKDKVSGLLSALAGRFKPAVMKAADRNPLDEVPSREGEKYNLVNYETGTSLLCVSNAASNTIAAVAVFKAFQSTPSSLPSRKFVCLSAEDIFRPVIPSGYIATKRKAEQKIAELCAAQTGEESEQRSESIIEPYFIRPSG
jgi:hypothetical protein